VLPGKVPQKKYADTSQAEGTDPVFGRVPKTLPTIALKIIHFTKSVKCDYLGSRENEKEAPEISH
jgi:hypothetical protein